MISVDIGGRCSPEVGGDILQLSWFKLPALDVILASPLCDQHTRGRTQTQKPRHPIRSTKLVGKAFEMIEYFQTLHPDQMRFLEKRICSMPWGREAANDLANDVHRTIAKNMGRGTANKRMQHILDDQKP